MPQAFKDQFFNSSYIQTLGKVIQNAYPEFNTHDFFLAVLDNDWEKRELKERMRHITMQLERFLPSDYPSAVRVLMQAVPFTQGAGNMVYPDFVEVFGLNDWELSMQALELFTQYGSSEFAIRPFILKNPDRAMGQMLRWAKHPNEHVRRLASEGCRPRLPWAMALPIFKENPTRIIPVLELLKNDSSAYVRRSVANNLNDISKDHPKLVLELAQSWSGKSRNTDKLIKHALRTLLKAGDTQALMLFGFGSPDKIDIGSLSLSNRTPSIGDEITFTFELNNRSKKEQKVRVEYKIHYMKKSGKLSPKVFQLSEKVFPNGKSTLQKKHSFQERTTRKHYPGQHKLEIIVNGESKAVVDFVLEA